MQRFPDLSREEIMVIAGIPPEELRHTRAAQEWLAEGRQEGRVRQAQRRQTGKVRAARFFLASPLPPPPPQRRSTAPTLTMPRGMAWRFWGGGWLCSWAKWILAVYLYQSRSQSQVNDIKKSPKRAQLIKPPHFATQTPHSWAGCPGVIGRPRGRGR
jgi:hypothetical protein